MMDMQDIIVEYIQSRLPALNPDNHPKNQWWHEYYPTGKVYIFFNEYIYNNKRQSFKVTVNKLTWDWKVGFTGNWNKDVIDIIRPLIEGVIDDHMSRLRTDFISRLK